MNFLGHLYFSNNDFALMQANLYGDFVKGKDLSNYPEKIQEGIRLHRRIDNFIDHHPAVIELLHILYGPLPKVAGIAVDLYFDHLLAKNWNVFHDKEYDLFVNDFYASIDFNNVSYSDQFYLMLTKMKEINWLHYYQFMEGLEKSSYGLSKRISFPNELANAPNVFVQFEKEITEVFHKYMIDAKAEFSVNLF